MEIVVFVLILALLVIVHEFGHFLAAKKNGVKVEEFGFGFPPRLFGIKKGETLYSVNLIPLGGFVKVYGEEYHETDKKLYKKLRDRAFVYKKPWQKSVIIIAGILGNFLLGWVLISFLFTQGVPTPTDKVIIEHVQADSPAKQSGFQPGDVIAKIEAHGKSYRLTSSSDLIKYGKEFAEEEIGVVVTRNNQAVSLKIIPRKNPPAGEGPLGITVTSFIDKKYVWYEAPFYGLKEAFNITKTIVTQLSKTIFQLATLKKPNVDVAGPIGIARYTGQAIKFGNNAVLELIALLSLNLAVINILPFPALDGGRLVFVVYEWVTRRRVNKTVERYTNLVGIIFLLSLAVVISINDIIKIYK